MCIIKTTNFHAFFICNTIEFLSYTAHATFQLRVNQVLTLLEHLQIDLVVEVSFTHGLQQSGSSLVLPKSVRRFNFWKRVVGLHQTAIRHSKGLTKAGELEIHITQRLLELIVGLHIILNDNGLLIHLTDKGYLFRQVLQSKVVNDQNSTTPLISIAEFLLLQLQVNTNWVEAILQIKSLDRNEY